MQQRTVFSILTASMIIAGCASHAPTTVSKTPAKAAMAPDNVRPAEPPVATAPAAFPDPDAELHAKYSLAVGGGPRSAVDPSKSIPSPPATIDVRPDAGVDAAIRVVPSEIPVGHLSQEILESPLKDPARFARCEVPHATRLDIRAAIYNGQAIGVDVRSNPNSRAVDFCVERVVRETSWVKELAINQIRVKL